MNAAIDSNLKDLYAANRRLYGELKDELWRAFALEDKIRLVITPVSVILALAVTYFCTNESTEYRASLLIGNAVLAALFALFFVFLLGISERVENKIREAYEELAEQATQLTREHLSAEQVKLPDGAHLGAQVEMTTIYGDHVEKGVVKILSDGTVDYRPLLSLTGD